MGYSKSSSKREVYSNTILPQETTTTTTKKNPSNRQPNFMPKTTGKRRTKHTKISRRKEIIKILAEINENERNNSKDYKIKIWFFEKINKIDKPLARLIKNKRDKNKLNKTRN